MKIFLIFLLNIILFSQVKFTIAQTESTYYKVVSNLNKDTLQYSKNVHYLNALYINDSITYYLKTMQLDSASNIFSCNYQLNYAYINITFDTAGLSSLNGLLKQKILAQIKKYNTTISPQKYSEMQSQLLAIAENSGYPFAKLTTSITKIKDSKISSTLSFDFKKPVFIDSIITGNALSKNYAYNIIQLKPGDIYSQEKILEIAKRIKQLPFLRLQAEPQVYFTSKQKVVIKMPIINQKVNEFEGILGFLPNTNINANNANNLIVTGLLNIKLVNQLKRAEQFQLRWKRLQPGSQELIANAELPYIYRYPIGIDGNINIFRRDSTFNNSAYGFGLAYRKSFTEYVKITYLQRQSVSGGLVVGLGESSFFPAVQSNLFGIEIETNKTNYIVNPIKGYVFNIKLQSGVRTVNEKQKNNSLEVKFSAENYTRLYKKWVLKTQVNYAQLFNDSVYAHELIRFGGVKSMRGFNDESLFGSTILKTGLELRYILGLRSNIFLLYDYAYLENKSSLASKLNNNKFIFSNLHAVGLGINLDTQVGILSLIYALGTEKFPQLDLRIAKIHVGYSAYF